jgi:hypothetical protein
MKSIMTVGGQRIQAFPEETTPPPTKGVAPVKVRSKNTCNSQNALL